MRFTSDIPKRFSLEVKNGNFEDDIIFKLNYNRNRLIGNYT
jgi:hypothetical protein